jgi:hypothetical protein
MAKSKAKGKAVSETLRQAILGSGLTLYRVAKSSGVTYPTLHRFAVHRRPISVRDIDKLCAYLELRLTR